MEQYLEEKKASQKGSTPPFQWQDRKKAAYQSPQRPVAASSQSAVTPRSPDVKPSDKKIQELDDKLAAIKILSWRQHRVPLTPVGGKLFAAKFFKFYRMVVLIFVLCESGASIPEEDRVRSDSERKE
ncbi:hypothetical protein Taro_036632 [Colocasia esculenta]|uniref:Uncharacterized protein n=1 Tax=Colocasia esculenta TaxID=4460 RepID=A0A843WDX3_COLES|nr:hypothetical protein [Colocasia esculenta]